MCLSPIILWLFSALSMDREKIKTDCCYTVVSLRINQIKYDNDHDKTAFFTHVLNLKSGPSVAISPYN